MAQLVLNFIDSYHDIMDNKSGEYIYNIKYYFHLTVSTFDFGITSNKK